MLRNRQMMEISTEIQFVNKHLDKNPSQDPVGNQPTNKHPCLFSLKPLRKEYVPPDIEAQQQLLLNSLIL